LKKNGEEIMSIKRFILIVGFTILAVILVACGSDAEVTDAYWSYWKACSDGDFNNADDYLTDEAKLQSDVLGVCGFTHDAINTIEAAAGNPPRGFSSDPEVVLGDHTATLTWIDDTGNLAIVSLDLVNGAWKVRNTVWSK